MLCLRTTSFPLPTLSHWYTMPVSDDPLDEVLKPPSNETQEQCQLRLAREAEAKRVSMAIDASIKAERQARRKKRIVRLLLLGQSESGKFRSSNSPHFPLNRLWVQGNQRPWDVRRYDILKGFKMLIWLLEFQRLYTPTAFREERILWRAVIQLNIVRSIRTILEALSYPTSASPYSSPELRGRNTSRVRPSNVSMTNSPPLPPMSVDVMGNRRASYGNGNEFDIQISHGSPLHYPPSPARYIRPSDRDPDPDSDTELTVANNSVDHNHSPRSDPVSSTTTLTTTPLDALKARLLPLRHIEALLIAKLVPPNEDEATHFAGPSIYQNGGYPSPSGNGGYPSPSGNSMYTVNSYGRGHGRSQSHCNRNQEIFVRPGAGWKGALARARVNFTGYSSSGGSSSSSSSSNNGDNTAQRPMSAGNTGLETPDEPQEVLYSCRKDMLQLWNDRGIREILRRKKIRMEDASGLWVYLISVNVDLNSLRLFVEVFWMTLTALPPWNICHLTTMYSKRDSRR